MSRATALQMLDDMVKAIQDNPDCFVGFELTIDPLMECPRMKRLTVSISLPNDGGENVYTTQPSQLPRGNLSGGPDIETSPETEANLQSDQALYGNSFWRVKNGKKVRVPPWEVTYDYAGTPRDTTNWPVEIYVVDGSNTLPRTD